MLMLASRRECRRAQACECASLDSIYSSYRWRLLAYSSLSWSSYSRLPLQDCSSETTTKPRELEQCRGESRTQTMPRELEQCPGELRKYRPKQTQRPTAHCLVFIGTNVTCSDLCRHSYLEWVTLWSLLSLISGMMRYEVSVLRFTSRRVRNLVIAYLAQKSPARVIQILYIRTTHETAGCLFISRISRDAIPCKIWQCQWSVHRSV